MTSKKKKNEQNCFNKLKYIIINRHKMTDEINCWNNNMMRVIFLKVEVTLNYEYFGLKR